MTLAEFALNMVVELLGLAIDKGVSFGSMDFFDRRRIKRRVEDATAEVIQPLLPFLTREGISEDRQRILLETCVVELRPLTDQPEALFRGSLNGQKIFENLYSDRKLPAVILEEGLGDTYALVCPRIATLLCQIPAAVKAWETEAWTESYRRLDDIARDLRSLFVRVDEMAVLPSREDDETLSIVRRAMAQKVGLELDLTGLRADRPYSGRFDDLFIHPEISFRNKEAPGERSIVGREVESFEKFIHPKSRAVIIGPPGAGKSTWSKWLQRKALAGHWTGFVVRKELRQLSAENLPSLHDLIRDVAGRHFAEELSAIRIGRWLIENKILFILDGFDEISPGDRDAIHEWIVTLATASRSCPFVLTSRPLTTSHLNSLGERWTYWSMEPFDKERVLEYIERWYKYAPLIPDEDRNVNAEILAQSWRSDPTIGPLTGNPLLLSTLLMVHHLDGSLPNGRSQLYRRYIDGMLGLWDDRRQVAATAVQLSIEQKRQVIRGLALHMFLTDQDKLEEMDALEWLRDTLRRQNLSLKPGEVLTALMERSGLIVGPGVYSFAHKSIAEYLVAETILQGDQRDIEGNRIDRFRLFEHRATDRWNTVTFLWAGLAPFSDLESFVCGCIDANEIGLAGGILLDQYHRLSFEVRRKLFLKTAEQLSSLELKLTGLDDNQPAEWLRRGNVGLWSCSLRSITDERHFYQLALLAAEDGALVCSDLDLFPAKMRDYLWVVLAIRPRDPEEWIVCLREQPPSSAAEKHWLFWVAKTVIHVKRNDILAIVELFRQARPEYGGLIPFALVAAYQDFTDWDEFSSVGSVLPQCDVNELDQELLLGSSAWVLDYQYDKPCDLLEVFEDKLDFYVGRGLTLSNSEDIAVREFIGKLRRKRNELIGGN